MTLYEVLENAQYNLNSKMPFAEKIAREQLNGVMEALANGKDLYDEYEEVKEG